LGGVPGNFVSTQGKTAKRVCEVETWLVKQKDWARTENWRFQYHSEKTRYR